MVKVTRPLNAVTANSRIIAMERPTNIKLGIWMEYDVLFTRITFNYVALLHCTQSCAVYCNRPCLCVCLWVRLTTASAQCLRHL